MSYWQSNFKIRSTLSGSEHVAGPNYTGSIRNLIVKYTETCKHNTKSHIYALKDVFVHTILLPVFIA